MKLCEEGMKVRGFVSVTAKPTISSFIQFYMVILKGQPLKNSSVMLKITVLEDTNSSVLNFGLAVCVTSSRRGVPLQQFM